MLSKISQKELDTRWCHISVEYREAKQRVRSNQTNKTTSRNMTVELKLPEQKQEGQHTEEGKQLTVAEGYGCLDGVCGVVTKSGRM